MVNRRQKLPEPRESPQTVEEKPEGWRALSPTRERPRRQYRGCGGGGGSVAELLRSLRRRSSANRVSQKFALMEFSELRVRKESYFRLYEP